MVLVWCFLELEGVDGFHEVANTLDLIESLQPDLDHSGAWTYFQRCECCIGRCRKKLDGFVQNPAKHARYGAKL
jgi:hypothetical protein